MWTRFFPAVEQARKLALTDKAIGEICQVHSDFNFNASDSEEYPTSFVYNHKLGGGASLLMLEGAVIEDMTTSFTILHLARNQYFKRKL